MKSLTLFRHAKTERESATGRDFDRVLTERGQGDAARRGEEIRDLGLEFDLALVSPAARAVETAEHAGIASPGFDDRIYDASTGQLLEIVQGVGDDVGRLLMIGHNPGFEHLASLLTATGIAMPTAALVEIELLIDRWQEAGKASGRLVRFITPKELG